MAIHKTVKNLRAISRLRLLVFIALILSGGFSHAADMTSYCVVPPYVKTDAAPNVLVLIDNSLDMYQPAYWVALDTANTTSTQNVYNGKDDAYGNKGQIDYSDNYTYSGNLNTSTTGTVSEFAGYYIPGACYKYSGNSFVEVYTNGSSPPNSGVSYTGAQKCPDGTTAGIPAAPYRGNLLNWATMSQYDVVESVIIGGHSRPEQVTPSRTNASAYTLKSPSSYKWIKYWPSYSNRMCVFTVNSGNVRVSDAVGGSCKLLDPTPFPIAQGDAPGPLVANADNAVKSRTLPVLSFGPKREIFASRSTERPALYPPDFPNEAINAVTKSMEAGWNKIVQAAAFLWKAINPVSEAYAGTCTITPSPATTDNTYDATVQLDFGFSFSASGGQGTYSWSYSGPTWLAGPTYGPTDFNDSTPAWEGIPPSCNNGNPYSFSATVTDQSGCTASISEVISVGTITPSITTVQFPHAIAGSSYSFTIDAMNGTEPYAWSISSGSLPAGFSLDSSTGIISGTSNTVGSSSFTIQMQDSGGSLGCTGYTIQKPFTLTVDQPTLAINQTDVNAGVELQTYPTFTFTAVGGQTGYYTWSVSSGGSKSCSTAPTYANGLPQGLSFDSGTGILSGVPISGTGTTAGCNYPIKITVTDGISTISNTYTLIIYTISSGGNVKVLTNFIPAPVISVPYTYNVAASGGSPCNLSPNTEDHPYDWNLCDQSVIACPHNPSCWQTGNCTQCALDSKGNPVAGCGGLPSGITLTAKGVISGTADAGTYYSLRLAANDCGGKTGYSKVITVGPVLNPQLRSSQNMNVWINRLEEAGTDVNGNSIIDSDPTTGQYIETWGPDTNSNSAWDGKQGIFQEFYDIWNPKARWGVGMYDKFGNFTVGNPTTACIAATPASPFYSNIQNALPQTQTADLSAGLYGALSYYSFSHLSPSPAYPTSAYPYGKGFTGCSNVDPIDTYPCRKNFVLILSAGNCVDSSHCGGQDIASSPTFTTAGCPLPSGTTDSNTPALVQNACFGYNTDLRQDKFGMQKVTTYIVDMMGTNPTNTAIMKAAALAGGGKYYEAQSASDLAVQLRNALHDMLGRAAAGTAASVISSGEGSGANLVQAIYYPKKKFGAAQDEIIWTGRLTNLWYFVDPNLNNSTIREDNGAIISSSTNSITYAPGDKILTLKTDDSHNDNIVQLYFDSTTETTKAHRWTDTNGDSVIDAALPDVNFENLGNLWEAGGLLWSRSPSSRTIYTSTTGNTLMPFSTSNQTALRSYLTASTDTEAGAIISWVQGVDSSPYRSRSVNYDGTGYKTWKLGDILSSTPKISSWLPLNSYHRIFSDSTYGAINQDPSISNPPDPLHYITSSTYQAHNMIFAGANDGMFHAFRLGTIRYTWDGKGLYDKALLDSNGQTLGSEAWAYIPKNALPYLKFIADPSYCHVYTVDLTPFIFDASINRPSDCTEADSTSCNKEVESWRTIVIGGMRYGGGCRKTGETCNSGGNCVNTPTVDPANSSTGLGYSSYFALDITDQENPQLLWEFSNDQLGYSTSGPAVVRISAKDPTTGGPIPTKNGKWFAVFASGPTGPIDTTNKQFMGRSDQNLRLFVLDLKTGTLVRTMDTGIQQAFAGAIVNGTLDTNLDYQDDVVYIPYVKYNTNAPSSEPNAWTDGGVLRLSTQAQDPSQWNTSKVVDGVGPVTAAVAKLQNNSTNKLWLFFGAGRYFFGGPNLSDDPNGMRKIYGIVEPCFDSSGFHSDCTASQTGSLTDVTTNSSAAESSSGWFISLDGSTTSVQAEREITDPVATTSGIVYFTTFKPYSNACELGGQSFIWAVKYNNGGDASALLKGQALIQVSTGSIEQLKLSDAFKDSVTGLNTGNRKTGALEGVPPPTSGLSIISTPPPVKRVMHIRER